MPNVARIYDYLLGGAQNFAVDRAAAETILRQWPSLRAAARANRNFLRVVVEHAVSLGITQFLDLGSGIPTVGSVHEIARRRAPEARVAYVDDEPVAVAHSRTLLAGTPGVTVTEVDLRDADAVLAAPGVAGLLDLERPVALLALAVFHFVGDDDLARAVLDRYRRALCPGSVLAMTHASTGYPVAAREEVNRTPTPVTPRSPERIAGLLGAFRVSADGMSDTSVWACERGPVTELLGSQAFVTFPLDAPDGPP